MSYALKRDEEVAGGLIRLSVAQLRRCRLIWRGSEPPHERAVHETRKAIKRVRALGRVLRFALPGHALASVLDRAASLGRDLGAARDAVVLTRTLTSVDLTPPPCPVDTPRPPLEELDSLIAGLDALRTLPVHRDGWALLRRGVGKTYRRGRRAFRRVQRQGSDEGLHTLRKRVKDLSYQLLALRRCDPDGFAQQLSVLDELAALLGDDHDLAVAQSKLSRSPAAHALLATRRASLRARIHELAKLVYRRSRQREMARLRKRWRAWQHAKPRVSGALLSAQPSPRVYAKQISGSLPPS